MWLALTIIVFVTLVVALIEIVNAGVNINMDISDRRNQLIYARLMREIEEEERLREEKRSNYE